jgi:hypothetical protein
MIDKLCLLDNSNNHITDEVPIEADEEESLIDRSEGGAISPMTIQEDTRKSI